MSFVVDEFGGELESDQLSGLSIKIPPNAISAPTMVRCRVTTNKELFLSNNPMLARGEALASGIVELDPPGVKFSRWDIVVQRMFEIEPSWWEQFATFDVVTVAETIFTIMAAMAIAGTKVAMVNPGYLSWWSRDSFRE